MGTRNVLADAVLFETTTTGTGTYSVGSAVTGYFAPADASPALNGARVSYVAVDSLTAPTIREIGEGVLASGTPWTLTRAIIRRSLTGGTAGSSAINWSAGTKYVFITAIATNTPQFDTDGWLHVASALVLATNGTERARVDSGGAWSFADAASLRSGAGAPAIPINSSGVGQLTLLTSADGGAATLGSGGTWGFFVFGITTATGTYAGTANAGVAAGGATAGSATAGVTWVGFAWRIS